MHGAVGAPIYMHVFHPVKVNASACVCSIAVAISILSLLCQLSVLGPSLPVIVPDLGVTSGTFSPGPEDLVYKFHTSRESP